MIRAGCPWRMIPNDLPPWSTVHQQAQRWIKAGCFEAMAHDLREVVRVAADKSLQPSAVILFRRTVQSTPESGHGTGCDGYKRKKGSEVHTAVEQERAQAGALIEEVQQATGRRWKWLLWFKVISEKNRPPPPKPVSASSWSRWSKPGKVLSCCRGALGRVNTN